MLTRTGTIYEFLRTGKELEKLPLLAEAFAEGRIAPSRVREISRVANTETEQFWLMVSTSSNCREVEKIVALTPKGGLPPTVSVSKEKDRRFRSPIQGHAPQYT